jgi:uncharacterized protein YkwD
MPAGRQYCAACHAASRARGVDLRVLRASAPGKGPAGPGTGARLDADARRRVIRRYFDEGRPPARTSARDGETVAVTTGARRRVEGPPPAPVPSERAPTVPRPAGAPHPPVASATQRPTLRPELRARPSPYVVGSAEWWRHRLGSEGLARASATSAPVRLEPPPSPAPAAPVHRRAPAARAARAATVTPAPAPALDFRGLARGWRSNHLLTAVLASFAVAVAILIWVPGRTVDPRTQSDPSLPVVAPPAGGPGQDAERAEKPSRSSDERKAEGATGGAGAQGDSACGSGGCPPAADPATELSARIDAARRRNGLPALLDDPDLERVARLHVDEMLEARKLFHTPNSQLRRRVTNWDILAESIGVGPTIDSLMNAFLNSAEDRANMLDEAFEHVGVAAVPLGQRLWVTVLFSDSRDPGTTLPAE